MRWTREELEAWGGREALDAEAEPVGHIYAVFVDDDSRAARWLAVQTGAHGDDVTPVPVDGAEPTGNAIRLPHPAATIRAAAHVAPGVDLTPEEDRQLTAFYGLEPAPAPSPRPVGGGPGADEAVVEGLRAAHALEREAYNRLQSLISTLADTELQHDVARHLTETEGHAAAVSGRLEQLESAPSSLQDTLGVATGKAAGMAGAVASGKDPGELLGDALAFERRECAAYDELAATARGAGDGATAEIADTIRADEEAMAETIAGALRRMGESPD